MDKREFASYFRFAICGTRGAIVRDHFIESKNGHKTIKDIFEDIKSDSLHHPGIFEDLPLFKNPDNDWGRLIKITEYLGKQRCCYPEICGTIAGMLYRDGE